LRVSAFNIEISLTLLIRIFLTLHHRYKVKKTLSFL